MGSQSAWRRRKTSARRGGNGSTRRGIGSKHKLGTAVNKIQLRTFMESLEHFPREAAPPTQVNNSKPTERGQGHGPSESTELTRTRGARILRGGSHSPSSKDCPKRNRALGFEELLAQGCPTCHRCRGGHIITASGASSNLSSVIEMKRRSMCTSR